MKIFPQTAQNNLGRYHIPDETVIPSPEEWVKNHHLLANLADILSHLQLFSSEDHTAEEQLMISEKEWKLLRENYSEKDWKDVQNYLLHLSRNS